MTNEVEPVKGEILPAFRAMNTDLQVSMDDVVAAFVATYENNLFKQKKLLTGEISEHDETLKLMRERFVLADPGTEFEVADIQPFGLYSKVAEKAFNVATGQVDFTVKVATPEPKGYSHYSNHITFTRSKDVNSGELATYREITKARESLAKELVTVLEAIKGVSRKEREVRGRIAIRKLEDSGYANLLEDAELKQLVQL